MKQTELHGLIKAMKHGIYTCGGDFKSVVIKKV